MFEHEVVWSCLIPLLSEIHKSDRTSGKFLSIHQQRDLRGTRMTSNEAYNTANMTPTYEEVDTFRFHGQREVPQDDSIYEDMDDDSPTNMAVLEHPLSAEQDGAADSQIAPTNVVSSPSPLPAEQDGAAYTQIAPRDVVSSQSPLPAAEQDDAADSQIAPRNGVSLQSCLPAEQDDLTDSQLTFNPAYDAIDLQEHISALDSENVQEQTITSRSEGRANIIP